MNETLIGPNELQGMSISQLARVIRKDWTKPNAKGKPGQVYFGAVPYLDAMFSLNSIEDNYGCDPGEHIVMYFLSNATTYRGEQAKLIKAELNRRLKAAK